MRRHVRNLGSAALVAVLPFIGSCVHLQQGLGNAGAGIAAAGKHLQSAADGAGLDVDMAGVEALGHKFSSLSNALAEANAHMTPEQEYFLGRTVAATLLADYGNRLRGVTGEGREARPGRGVAYLQSIAQAVLEGARRTAAPEERLPTALRVGVVESEAPNAFATPGGFVVVTTGMLALAQTEDELAAVLAHEASHVVLGHGLGAIKKGRIKEMGEAAGQKVSEAVGHGYLGKLATKMGGMAGDVVGGLKAGYPHDWELQSDARAVKSLQVSGYDPAALGRVLERLEGWQKAHGAAGHGATHPPARKRIEALGTPEGPRFEGAPLAGQALAAAEKARSARFEASLRTLVASAE